MNFNNIFRKSVKGIVAANTPELGSALACYYTFKDMPYAKGLAIYQVRESADLNTLVGAIIPHLSGVTDSFRGRQNPKGGRNNYNGPKPNQKKKRRG